jgi:hypothetical protein
MDEDQVIILTWKTNLEFLPREPPWTPNFVFLPEALLDALKVFFYGHLNDIDPFRHQNGLLMARLIHELVEHQ